MFDLFIVAVVGGVVALALERAYHWWKAQKRCENVDRRLRTQLALYRELDTDTNSKSLLARPMYHTETEEIIEKHFSAAALQLFFQVTQMRDKHVSDVIEFLEMILRDWDIYYKVD